MPRTTSTRATDAAAAAALLRDHPRYRVLERLPRPFADLPGELPPGARHVGIVDVETTGLDPMSDRIIELALMHVAVAADGTLLGHSRPQSWRENPGRLLDPAITALTGLSDADLADQRLDERVILGTLARCDLLLAHNSKFDLGFIDRRFPTLAEKPWACSCVEVPWLQFGHACRKLEHLLAGEGAFYEAHRAESDVWALFQLLQRPAVHHQPQAGAELPPGTTYLQQMLASSAAGAVRLRAHGLAYEHKDWVKARGYAWDPVRRVWWRDVAMCELAAEQAAFADAGHPVPQSTELNAVNRYRL